MNGLQVSYGTTAANRQLILDFVKSRKAQDPGYRVIDIGGAAGGWTAGVVDTLVDINKPADVGGLQFDICHSHQWGPLIGLVEERGPYDFAICTHTLEDLYNPVTVLEYMPVVAKAGVITTPSINTELSNVENINWIGYIHHRWIFDAHGGEMHVIPKLPVLEYMCRGRKFFNSAREEIMYFWNGSIPHKLFMGNYLGPNAAAVLRAYNNLINGVHNG